MKAKRIVWPAPGKVSLEQFEIPEPKPQEVLIRMDCTAVSRGTELAWLQARPNTPAVFPQYPGYSGSGRILATGSEVTALHEGDRVIVDHCGHASHVLCSQDGWRGQGISKIEDAAISSEAAAFVVIATMSLQGVRKARIELGEGVAVTGLGLLGQFAVQFARLSGAFPVIVLNRSETRRGLALRLGADHAFSPDDTGLVEACRRLTGGRGLRAIIESSGVDAAVRQSLDLAAHLGRVVLLGCTRGINTNLNLYEQVHKKGVSIIGAHNYVRPLHESSPGYWTTREDVKVILDLMSRSRLEVESMISEIVEPADAPDVYRRLQEPDHNSMGVVFDWR